MVSKHLSFLFLIFLGSSCMAQIDTMFWFALPAVSSSQPMTHRLTFQSYDNAAVIEIEKLFPSGTTVDTLHMGTQQYRRYDLGDPGSFTPNATQQRGILIRSTAAVSCVYDLFVDTLRTIGERYTLKGSTGLGTHFVVPAPYYIIDYYEAHNSIEMIATEDSTLAVIDIPNRIPGIQAPQSWSHDTIRLQRGQSHIVRTDTAAYVRGGNRVGVLLGSIVRTNKPVALNSSDAGNYGNGLPAPSGEQLVPAHFLGTKYLVPREGIFCDDPYRRINIDSVTTIVIPLYDHTNIRLSGSNSGAVTQDRGQPHMIRHYYNTGYLGTSYTITSDKPVAVITVLCHNGRQSFTLNPPIDCTGSGQIAAYSAIDADSTFDYFLIGPPRARTQASVNGTSPQGASWSNWLDWSDDYVFHLQVTVDTLERIHAAIPSGKLHLYTWNRGGMSRFLTCHSEYAAEAHLAFDMGFTEFSSRDTIFFRHVQRNMRGVRFIGPNGIRIDNPGDTILLVAYPSRSGWYYLRGATIGGCTDSIVDSIFITVNRANEQEIILFDTVCGTSYRFGDTLITQSGHYVQYDTIEENYVVATHLYLTVRQPPSLDIELQQTCNGDPYYFLDPRDLPDTLDYAWSWWPADAATPFLDADSMLRFVPEDLSEYYLTYRYRDLPACPVTDTLALEPVGFVHAFMELSSEQLSFDDMNLTAFDRSSHATGRQWYLDGSLQACSDAILHCAAAGGSDSLCITLVAFNPSCADTMTRCVSIDGHSIYFPNVFTPGAESNNRFAPIGNIAECELWIYDRRGDIVYHTADALANPWDGTHDGRRCQQGAYVYLCRYRNPGNGFLSHTGTVTLVR